MQKNLTIALFVFFGAIAVVLVGGAFWVFFGGTELLKSSVPEAPEIPGPPLLATDTAAAAQQVSLYQHQTSAYSHRVTAYDKYLAASSSRSSRSADRVAQFEAVAKALSPFLTALVTAFIAYAFAKTTANIVRNVVSGQHKDADLQDLVL